MLSSVSIWLLKMNVDKFGHHLLKNQRVFEALSFENTIKKDDNGNFNAQFKKIVNATTPIDDQDVANKSYVDEILLNIINQQNLILERFINKSESTIKSISERLSFVEDQCLKNLVDPREVEIN